MCALSCTPINARTYGSFLTMRGYIKTTPCLRWYSSLRGHMDWNFAGFYTLKRHVDRVLYMLIFLFQCDRFINMSCRRKSMSLGRRMSFARRVMTAVSRSFPLNQFRFIWMESCCNNVRRSAERNIMPFCRMMEFQYVAYHNGVFTFTAFPYSEVIAVTRQFGIRFSFRNGAHPPGDLTVRRVLPTVRQRAPGSYSSSAPVSDSPSTGDVSNVPDMLRCVIQSDIFYDAHVGDSRPTYMQVQPDFMHKLFYVPFSSGGTPTDAQTTSSIIVVT